MRLLGILLLLVFAVADVAVSHDDAHHHHHGECSHGHDHVVDAHDHHNHEEDLHHPPSQCDHGHGNDLYEDHENEEIVRRRLLLPEEAAEEEDLASGRTIGHHHEHGDHLHAHGEAELSPLGVWISAMGCSLLVSMASLVCLIILPVIFFRGKPSKGVVDSLAVFGAGAMLGDAFLHQLPHAFGGENTHSHDHHDRHSDHGHSHAHSLKDLSIGLSVLSGIILFFIVEKIVRFVEDNSRKGMHNLGHGHHHHHNRGQKDVRTNDEPDQPNSVPEGDTDKETDGHKHESRHGKSKAVARKRSSSGSKAADGKSDNSVGACPSEQLTPTVNGVSISPSSLVFGYLNLFSDGVHNFTDGMALGSAFLLHGSVGGWSRTLFLLAHELPQEVGDFGILVRSGFSVPKALFFNFLSALVALAGTALALILGKDPGHSSLIEGFTAGGFIYIAVAGVIAEMNSGKITLGSTMCQLTSLLLGMMVALGISLVE